MTTHIPSRFEINVNDKKEKHSFGICFRSYKRGPSKRSDEVIYSIVRFNIALLVALSLFGLPYNKTLTILSSLSDKMFSSIILILLKREKVFEN